jgi:hypothetical protein
MIRVDISGVDDALAAVASIHEVCDAKRGRLYSQLTADVQNAIVMNADPVYSQSPAKALALRSCSRWQHNPGNHVLNIESLDYANYKQYGCGGLAITTLVEITPAQQDIMADHIISEVAANM